MEFTKGELNCTKNQSFILCNIVNGKGEVFCNQPRCKDHAKELVRRWNAFEDGGLVDELRKALETAEVELEQRYKAQEGSSIDKLALKIVKDAIAKA